MHSALSFARLRRSLALVFAPALVLSAAPLPAQNEEEFHPLEFIDVSIENASPLWHGIAEDGTVELHLLYDHERFLDEIREHPLVEIETRGHTVEGRELEIVRVGDPEAPRSVFLRARSHPWEPGGNWVAEGLVRRLLKDDAEARRFLEGYCVYLQPMANKDGVVRGMTRFNVRGKDLNRDWNEPADPDLAPENAALEEWLEERIAAGRAPDLAICLHNDGGGRLHLSRPPVPGLESHLERMAVFEALLREHTWFTEGSTGGEFRNAGTLGEGWLMRYGIDALIAELNCNWIAGLEDYPSAKHWMHYGEGLARVFHDYFARTRP